MPDCLRSRATSRRFAAPTVGVRVLGVLASLALLIPAALPVHDVRAASPAQGEEETDEYKIKAAFLYNIVKLISWPKEVFDSAKAPIVVLVVGENPFGKELEKVLQSKEAHGRKFVVRYSQQLPTKLDAQVVFMKGLEEKQRATLRTTCQKDSTLLIGDRSGLAAEGAGLGFYIDKRRVRFEVNVDALKRAKLTASSQLLKLARIVKDQSGAHRAPDSDRDTDSSPESEARGASPSPAALRGESAVSPLSRTDSLLPSESTLSAERARESVRHSPPER